MRGLNWCIWLTVVGALAALAGLRLGIEPLGIAGAGAIATVWIGWPVLLIMGALTPDRRA